MKNSLTRNGFTLVELIVVVSILAILAGALIPRITNRMAQSRDAQRLSDIRTIKTAVDQYFIDKGTYPAPHQNSAFGGWDVSQDGDFIPELFAAGYLKSVPHDPLNDDTYQYRYYVYEKGTGGCKRRHEVLRARSARVRDGRHGAQEHGLLPVRVAQLGHRVRLRHGRRRVDDRDPESRRLNTRTRFSPCAPRALRGALPFLRDTALDRFAGCMSNPTKTVRVPSLGLDFEVLGGDSVIGPAIERGMWEEHETRLFRAHLSPGDRVIDVGANVGWFGVQAVLAGADVTCFEPVPEIADVCQRNLDRAMKHGSGRATLRRAAAGSEAGTAEIALAAQNFGDNRVLDPRGARPGDMGAGAVISIRIERIDDVLTGPFRVIKIDTQDRSGTCSAGMKQILEQSRRCMMLLEYWPYALRGVTGETMLEFIGQLGFTTGKATAAPYPMSPARIHRQVASRDPIKGGIDLYATRGVPFHVGGIGTRVRALARSLRES
jgi:type II secretion system protein G